MGHRGRVQNRDLLTVENNCLKSENITLENKLEMLPQGTSQKSRHDEHTSDRNSNRTNEGMPGVVYEDILESQQLWKL